MVLDLVLELGKAGCFFLCIASLYEAAIYALFVPGTSWEQRLLLACLRLGWAAYVCIMSGLVFTLPLRSNPERGKRLSSTLPVRLFLWGSTCIVALFFTSWFLGGLAQDAAPFISSRTLQR